MHRKGAESLHWRLRFTLRSSAIALATFTFVSVGQSANTASDPADKFKTATPIKHVIVLIGENRGLDHTFGVYKPKGKGQTISNILSKGIVNADGSPGPHFAQAQQFQVSAQSTYYIGAPKSAKTLYGTGNLMPVIVEAVEAHATVGEISDAMRHVYGEYQETVVI